MLRFEIKPDIVFLDMLDDAIEQMIDEIDLEEPSDQDESFADKYAPQQSIVHGTTRQKSSSVHCNGPSTRQNCTNRPITIGYYCMSVWICIARSSMICGLV